MSSLFTWLMLGLAVLFAALAAFHAVELIAGDGPEWEELAITQLESGVKSPPEWVAVTHGHLYWPGATISFNEDLVTKERTPKGVYVPLVSLAHGERLEAQVAEGADPDLANVAAVVFVPQAEVDRDFPWLASGEFSEALTPYEIKGRLKRGRTMPVHVKKHIAKHTPTLKVGLVVLLEQGAQPVEWSHVGGSAAIALIMLIAGVGRLRRRRETRAAVQSVPILA